MAAVLVTGSSDGIGRQTARDLVGGGHRVVLHARNEQRADEARAAVPGAAEVVVGDLSTMAGAEAVAGPRRHSGATTRSSTTWGSAARPSGW